MGFVAMNTSQPCLSFRDGTLAIHTPWTSDACGAIFVNGEPVLGPWSAQADGRQACRHAGWQLTLSQEPAGVFGLSIANASSAPAMLRTVHFARWRPEDFAPRLEVAEFRELIHGGSFMGMSSGVKCVGRKGLGLDFVTPSSMLTVYQREAGQARLLGVLPPVGDALSEFRTLHSEPHMEAAFGFEASHVFNATVKPGAAVRTSRLVALAGPDGTDLMIEFGKLWHERLDRKPRRRPAVGWNSWDYYSGAVSRQSMDDNLAAAGKLFGDALEVFAIDEGWEAQWGTWEPNLKFADGMEAFCQHVKAAGRTPGVWTSPLLVNTYNPLFLEHPGWFACRGDGQLQTDTYAYGPMAYLDVTQPEVIDHLGRVFARLRAAGFEYFKVDFCHCILKAEKFADASVTRQGLIRRAFAAIREAIGDDAYLLSCGAPYESVVGLVDSVRTTGDIHIYWGHVLRNAGALCVRWWMQGNLWNCDPDFLVVRGPDTAEPPFGKRSVVVPGDGWIAGREFSEMEARTYALLVHLSGGDVMLGDALAQLRPNALAMLERLLEPRANAAVPIDLFESDQDLPRIWVSTGGPDTLVGLFNWSDKTARIEFDPARCGLKGTPTDFWTDQPITNIATQMPRRSCLALRFVH